MKEAIYAMSNTQRKHLEMVNSQRQKVKGIRVWRRREWGSTAYRHVDSVLQDSHLSGDTVAECLPSAYKGLDPLSNTAEDKGTSWHAGTCNPR